MEIFNIEDGKIYHGSDWRELQRKIYREFKEKTVRQKYSTDILFSSFKYMVYDSLIDESNIQTDYQGSFNANTLSYESGSQSLEIRTKEFVLDTKVLEGKLDINIEGNIENIRCSVSIDGGASFKDITPFEEFMVGDLSDSFILKIEILENSDIKINDYCLYLGKE